MALAIDASSPPVKVQSLNNAPTVTTDSFTPPDGSLLLIRWAGNSHATNPPAQPTITDNLGAPLTYTLLDWQSISDSPGVAGQAACWWASVSTGTAMTVTVTTGEATTTVQQAALHVTVITGHNTHLPIVVHGKSGSASASSISQPYTAVADSGQGFLAVCDWDDKGAETAGTGCTLTDGGSGSITGQISYGFIRRSSADDSNGASNTLNATLPGTSTNLAWVWAEVVPQVGDPAEADPPPVINWHPPGDGISPNGVWNPWLGTDNAPPPDTGLRIHESSPGMALNTAGTATAATTASFTPPAGSLLLVLWVGNSVAGATPGAPTITDSLGTPLTYTRSDWQSFADVPHANGQAAAWTAPVVTSAPMTVTVNNNGASPARHAAFQVLVLVNQNASTPVGAHGASASTSAQFIAQSYTAQADNAQGFLAVCDWDTKGTPLAGTDCYWANARPENAGTIPTQLSYGLFKRLLRDDVNTVTNRLNAQAAATSTNLTWVYIEILPASLVVSSPTPAPLVVTPPWQPVAIPPVTISASQPLGNPAVPSPQPTVVTPPFAWPPVAAPQVFDANIAATVVASSSPQPLVVSGQPPPARTTATIVAAPGQSPGTPALVQSPPFAWPLVPQVTISTNYPLGNPAVGTPQPLVVGPDPALPQVYPAWQSSNPPPPPAVVTGSTPAPLVVGPPFAWPPVPFSYLSASQPLGNPAVGSPQPLVVTGQPRAAVTAPFIVGAPAQAAGTQPVVSAPQAKTPLIPGALIFSGPPATTVFAATPAPLLVTPPWRPVVIPKTYLFANFPLGNPAVGSPQPLVVSPVFRWPVWTALLIGAGMTVHSCSTSRPSTGTTTRPSTGTTAYALATTVRPSSGITVRPNTGVTADPC